MPLLEHAPQCTPDQLDAAFDSAQKAYRDWRVDETSRRAALRRAAHALFAAADDIGEVLTAGAAGAQLWTRRPGSSPVGSPSRYVSVPFTNVCL